MSSKKIAATHAMMIKGILLLTLGLYASAFGTQTNWNGSAGDKDWHNATNWNAGVPTSNDTAIFGSGSAACSLRTNAVCKNFLMGSTYAGNFHFGNDTLIIYGDSADFRSVGTFASNSGAIKFVGAETKLVSPSTFQWLPTVVINVTDTVKVVTTKIKIKKLVLSSGWFDLGTAGFLDTVENVYTNGGSLHLNSAEFTMIGDTIDLSGIDTITSMGTAGSRISFAGSNKKQFFFPSASVTIPSIILSGATDTVVVSGANGLKLGMFSFGTGAAASSWQWGSNIHYIDSLSGNSGSSSMDLGTSTVKIKCYAYFLATSFVPSTGTLEFNGARGSTYSQVLKPPSNDTLPNILHSGTDSLRLDLNNLRCMSFSQTAGVLDFGNRNIITVGDFSVTNGTSATFARAFSNPTTLNSRKISVGGNCLLSGQNSSSLLHFNGNVAAYCTLQVVGTLTANYDSIAFCKLFSASPGVARFSKKGNGDSNWVFLRTWANNGSMWTVPSNWVEGQKPGSGDSVLFNTGTVACSLDVDWSPPISNRDTIGTIKMTAGYVGTLKFGVCTLAVTREADFRSGGGIQSDLGTIKFIGKGGKHTFIPKASTLMPNIGYSPTGTDSVFVATNALQARRFLQNDGHWFWGSEGLTHSVRSIGSYGAMPRMSFGNSTVKVDSGDVYLYDLDPIYRGTGTLEFSASYGGANFQTLTAPFIGDTLPIIKHTGTDTLKFGSAIPCSAFVNTSGRISLNGYDLTTRGDFIIQAGNATTFANYTLDNRYIRVGGKAKLSGTAPGGPGNMLNLTAGSSCYFKVSDSLVADYALISNIYADSTNGGTTGTPKKAIATITCTEAGYNGNYWLFPFSSLTTLYSDSLKDASVAFGNYDMNDSMDMIVTGTRTNSDGPGQVPVTSIYKNGNYMFSTISTPLISDSVTNGGAVWGDYDNDGDLDLFVSGAKNGGTRIAQLFRNANGTTFTAVGSAVFVPVDLSAAAWGDYNNDGRLDLAYCGRDNSGNSATKIYRNNGDDTFTDIGGGIAGIEDGSVAWGDYDNDGDLDLLATGVTNPSATNVTKIFRNTGNDVFTDINAAYLPQVSTGSGAWGDFNNDGHLDILLSGFDGSNAVTAIYQNNTDGTFTSISSSLTGLINGSARWLDFDNDGNLDCIVNGRLLAGDTSANLYRNGGSPLYTFTNVNAGNIPATAFGKIATADFDNDGDMDIVVSGVKRNNAGKAIVQLFKNNYSALSDTNAKPHGDMTGFQSSVQKDTASLWWNFGTDDKTQKLTYNVRLAPTSSSVNDTTVSSMTDTAGSRAGRRLLPAPGNTGMIASYKIKGLAQGSYRWSVQAIDQNNRGSVFSAPQNFTVDLTPPAFSAKPLTAPAVGVKWFAGDSQYVNWTSTDITDNGLLKQKPIRLQLSTDNGSTFGYTLAAELTNSGSSRIALPLVNSAAARVRLCATDSSGNTRYDTSSTFSLYTNRPTQAITSFVNKDTVSILASVSGTAADTGLAPGLQRVDLAIQRGSDQKWLTALSSGDFTAASPLYLSATGTTSWSASLSGVALSAGMYVFVAVALDLNNYGPAAIQYDTVYYSPVAPSVAVSSPSNKSYINLATTTSIIGTAADGGSGLTSVAVAVKQASDGKYLTSLASGAFGSPVPVTFTATGTTSWSLGISTVPFSHGGTYIFEINAFNVTGTGLAVPVRDTVYYDASAPTVTVSTPVNKSHINIGTTAAIQGTAADAGAGVANVLVAIKQTSNGQYLTALSGGTFSSVSRRNLGATGTATWNAALGSVPFISGGQYIFEVTSYDGAGLTSAITYDTVSYDDTEPTVTISGPPNKSYFRNDLAKVYGSASDVGSGINFVKLAIKRGSDGKYLTAITGGLFTSANPVNFSMSGTSACSLDVTSVPFGTSGEGMYIFEATAFDNTGLMNHVLSADTAYYDGTEPVSTLTSAFTNSYVKTWTPLNGLSSDTYSGIARVEYAEQDSTTGKYYTPSGWVDTVAWHTISASASWILDTCPDAACRSLYTSGHTYKEYIRAADRAGNVEKANIPKLTWVYDVHVPTISTGQGSTFTFPAGGESFVGGSLQTIMWSQNIISDNRLLKSRPIKLEYSNASNWTDATPGTLIAADLPNSGVYVNWQAPAAPGSSYRIRLTATDSAGNSASAYSYLFSVDTAKPAGTLILTDNNGLTRNGRVPYTIGGPAAADSMRMALAPDTAAAVWRPFAGSGYVDVSPGGNGAKTVCAQVKSRAGLVSAWVSDMTVYDSLAPNVSVTMQPVYFIDTWQGVFGTAADNLSGVQSIKLALRNKATGQYYQTGTPADTTVAGHWNSTLQMLPATGTTAWSFGISQKYLQTGDYAVIVTVADNAGNAMTPSDTFNFRYSAPPVNNAQVMLVNRGDTAVAVSIVKDDVRPSSGTQLYFAMVYSRQPQPSDTIQTGTSDALLRFRAGYHDTSFVVDNVTKPGLWWVVTSVRDSFGYTSQPNFDTVRIYNTPPRLSRHQDITIHNATFYVDTLRGYDPNGDALRYKVDGSSVAGSSITCDSITGIIRWATNTAPSGSYVLKVGVSDPYGGFAMDSFTVTLTSWNNSVVNLTNVGDTAIAVALTREPGSISRAAQLYGAVVYNRKPVYADTVQIGTSDALLRLRTWYRDTVFTVNNTVKQGTWWVGAVLRDSLGNISEPNYDSVHINNIAPRMTHHADLSVRKGTTLVDSLIAFDRNGDTLTYAIKGVSSGLLVSGSKFTWKTDSAAVATYPLIAVVSDTRGGVGADTFLVTILPLNYPPKIVLRKKQVAFGAAYYQMSTQLADSLATFSGCLKTLDSGTVIDSQPGIKGLFTFYPLVNGRYVFTCKATDSKGLTDSLAFTDTFAITAATAFTFRDTLGWQMISVPAKALAAERVKSSDGFLLHWDETRPEQAVYSYYAQAADLPQVMPGLAYWRKSPQVQSIVLTSEQLNRDTVATIRFIKGMYGWNQIGSPYPYLVKFSSALPLWKWNGLDFEQADSVLEPWSGYWVLTDKPDSIRVQGRPYFAGVTASAKRAKYFYSDQNNWQLQLVLHAGSHVDADNVIGFNAQAKEGSALLTRAEPPRMSDGGHLYIYHPEWKKAVVEYSSDIRKRFEGTAIYQIGIAPQSEPQAYISIEGLSANLPFDVYLAGGDSLVQVKAGTQVAIGASKETQYRTLFVTQDKNFRATFPTAFNMGSPYPNPMRPSSMIRYTLPYDWAGNGLLVSSSYEVSIKLYDMNGRILRELVHRRQDAGSHSVLWDGKSSSGRRVVPGTYVCALTAGKFNAVKKIIMVR